jgi:hypothetical protein
MTMLTMLVFRCWYTAKLLLTRDEDEPVAPIRRPDAYRKVAKNLDEWKLEPIYKSCRTRAEEEEWP